MEGLAKIALTAGGATGNLTQIYPNYAPAGSALPIASNGTLRTPMGGRFGQVSIQTDGNNGGTIEIWDLNGLDVAADVSSLTTVTNAQLVTLQSLGKAKCIWSQNFAATPSSPAPWSLSMGFMRGLAARFVGATGTCNLNIILEGGFQLRVVPCGFAG